MLDAFERSNKFSTCGVKVGVFNAYINVFLPLFIVGWIISIIFNLISGIPKPASLIRDIFLLAGGLTGCVLARRVDNLGQMFNLIYLQVFCVSDVVMTIYSILVIVNNPVQMTGGTQGDFTGVLQSAANGIFALATAGAIVILCIGTLIAVVFCTLYTFWFVDKTKAFCTPYNQYDD